MFVYVYRLRFCGDKVDRFTHQRTPPSYGDLRMEGAKDRVGVSLARLLTYDSDDQDLIPLLHFDRWRITSGLVLAGTERIFRGVKSKGEVNQQS